MRKIYLVPNFLTTLNMFCGFYSVIGSVRGDFSLAAWSIIVAAFFDMLDGRVARMTHTTSSFGVEYDSMSDLISFGMAPAMMLYLWALEPFGRLGWLVSFLFLACAALRLARFNISSSIYSKSFFMGLPSPAAAGAVATFVLFRLELGWPSEETYLYYTLGAALVLGTLMVSTVPFPSFKEFNWKSRFSFGYLLLGLLMLVLIAVRPEVVLFLIVALYVSLSLIWNTWRLGRKMRGKSISLRAEDPRA